MLPLMRDGHRTVRRISPVAAYIGGKSQLAAELVKLISRIPHHTYAEPFVGMGGVFLRRTEAAPAEVINDYNRDVATLFRILQRHYAAFLDMLKFQLTSRAEFERLQATEPDTLTDLERAARFLYLQRSCYGGKVRGRNFGVSVREPGAFNVTRLIPLLDELHERLSGVIIECLPWQEFLPRYDRPETLFYLDPPYWGSEDYYLKNSFPKADFSKLADVLRELQGRWILSINDVPEIREMFAWAAIEQVTLAYTLPGGDDAKTVSELIISTP